MIELKRKIKELEIKIYEQDNTIEFLSEEVSRNHQRMDELMKFVKERDNYIERLGSKL